MPGGHRRDQRSLLCQRGQYGARQLAYAIDRNTGTWIAYCVSAAFQPTPEQRAAKLAISIRKARLEAKTAASTESYIKRGRILSRGIVHLLEPGSYNQPGYRNEMPRWMLDLWGSIETNYNVARQDARTGYRSGWLGL